MMKLSIGCPMFHRLLISASLVFWATIAPFASAAELVMVEQQGCAYCREWHKVIGPIYAKTPEGAFAPLRVIDIDDPVPADLRFARKAVYTPTFILVEDGVELGRIQGYPGEDFFWGLLDMLLQDKTDYVANAPTNG
ncbi:thioredoxin family protein [Rhodobacteraceae bacterium D3-12]|nr:thioredoxin family protein [Rhodobacteraceae bacterium D3-12]